ncbi:hypothetical protein UREG_00453 [Uncinocarpus reesii 1704]|uniref:DNA-(apurinic or apyrimidinic site) endonuclease 2 n=1 Tax=Uncinocarpus reesii (strain UAMH 1704) TaxID=336963 RepID=C4JE29_UNCRE|nr:uncharacterized protein UREG_00453 [Uncinocarpus reesii 1704]EEP75607.1 hypothetical protein UREG_00453 [Uncinocarpus reesii 1704]
MVLVPGWDCFFSLPKQKKGSTTPYRELSKDDQIGGYPNFEQLELLSFDPKTIDSEGRCVILEFPAFVLLGVYCPANRDENRDAFRSDFLNALDMRVRNLIAIGKRVIVMGDLNVSSDILDSAHAIEAIRKCKLTELEFLSSPPRLLFNQLVKGGKPGTHEIEQKPQVLLDLCRNFHPNRQGMYTCWEQRINARPGNYGARIDYVLCSMDMEDWFVWSDIQEGLMGSDHCPVYALIKDTVRYRDADRSIWDIVNPPGVFHAGLRKQPAILTSLPLSGRLIPEFHRRRSLKEMFQAKSTPASELMGRAPDLPHNPRSLQQLKSPDSAWNDGVKGASTADYQTAKRTPANKISPRPVKRSRKLVDTSSNLSKGQQTLAHFMEQIPPTQISKAANYDVTLNDPGCVPLANKSSFKERRTISTENTPDPAAKESWAKLFTRKAPPRCEGHNEPCIVLVTKKAGPNCGRSFWICPRPLGPSGDKEIGTPWRCPTFIWCSDWKSQE